MSTNDGSGSRLVRWGSFPRILWVALGGALLVTLPGIRVGLFGDTYLIQGILDQRPSPVPLYDSPLALFRYAVGDPASMQQNIAKGLFPWWTLPELKMAFFRPLSSALMWLDHAVFGHEALGMQVHSVLWYAALVVVIGALMRRVLPSAVGGLALLLFAVDGKHAALVVSISDRNYIVAAAFACLGLLFHVRWREGDGARFLPLSILGLGFGLASSETGLIVYAYLVAYELMAGKGTAGVRLRALLPAALVLGAWGIAYVGLGFGVYGSDMFISPAVRPLDWLRAWPTALPALLGSLLLSVPAEFAEPDRWTWVSAVGLFGFAVVGLLLRVCWGRLGAEERRHVRWMLAGGVLALPTALVMAPTVRQLLMPSLGGAVAVGTVLARSFSPRKHGAWGWAGAGSAGVLALLNLVGSPITGWQAQSYIGFLSQRTGEVQDGLTHEVDEAKLPSQRIVVLAQPSLIHALYALPRWWATGHTLPRAWWTLSFSPYAQRVTRTAPDTLELEATEGRFFSTLGERAHRGAPYALTQGAVVQLDGARAEITEVDAQGVRKLRFHFDTSVDDPSLVFLQWKDRGLRRVTLPPVGGRFDINVP